MKDVTTRRRRWLAGTFCAVAAAATLGSTGAQAAPITVGQVQLMAGSSDRVQLSSEPVRSVAAWRTVNPLQKHCTGEGTRLASWRTQKRIDPSSTSTEAFLATLNSWRAQVRPANSDRTSAKCLTSWRTQIDPTSAKSANSWRTQKQVEPSTGATISLNAWRTQTRVEPSTESTISLNAWRTQRDN